MVRKIDIENWNRKEHYHHYIQMNAAIYGITTEVDCTRSWELVKTSKYSFFTLFMHASIKAVNTVENFRMRYIDDEPIVYDVIHVGSTIGRKDGTFGFSFIEYSDDVEVFHDRLQAEIAAVQQSSGLRLEAPNIARKDCIYYSTLPWIKFTGLSHAHHTDFMDTVPKISFGKVSERDGRMYIPMSVHVHHAFVDGLHIGQYIEAVEALM